MSIKNKKNYREGYSSNWVRTNIDIMQAETIGFVNPPRLWQEECFNVLAASNPVSVINAPMGSGKSTTLCMIAYDRLSKNDLLKAIIVVPENLIGKGFGEKFFSLPDGTKVDWSVQHNLIINKKSTIQQLKDFIIEDLSYSKYYLYSRICICTNQTLCKAFDSFSDDEKSLCWKNLIILFDEAHHVKMQKMADDIYEMNVLGQVLDYSYNSNNEILLMTASLFRGDKKGILSSKILDDAKKYSLSFYDYWAQMNHLESLKYDFTIGVNNYTKDIKDAFEILAEDNLKKQIIFIPHPQARMSTGKGGKYQEIEDILEQKRIELNGDIVKLNKTTGIYHITNCEGLDYKVADLVSEQLSKRVHRYFETADININRDAVDCIIALNKANEGFDWIHADGMIIVGVRHSTTRLYQMIGRLLRDVPNKPIVKVVHMLDFAPNLPVSPNLEGSLNDSLKFLYATFLLLDVLAPSEVQINDRSGPSSQSGNKSCTNIFDDLEIDLNMREDLVESSIKKLASKFNEGNLENLQDFMPEIIEAWLKENDIMANDEEIQKLADKVWNTFPTTSQSGINLSDIEIKLCESIGPLGFLMRFAGYDITLESCANFISIMNQGEMESNKKTHELCQWVIASGRDPKSKTSDEYENKLNSFLCNRRQAKKGADKTVWYESDQKIAESYEIKYLFEVRDLESMSNSKTHDLCKWIIENNNIYPKIKTTYSDEQEKTLSYFLSDMRKAYKNSTSSFYHSNQLIAESYGLPYLFVQTLEDISKLKTHKLCQWIKENDRIPSSTSKDEEEKELSTFMHNKKAAKHNKRKKGNAWYESNQEIAESYGLNNIFDYEDKEVLSNEQTHTLCKWVIKNNYVLPTRLSKTDEEKQIYNLLTVRRKAKSGKVYTWYESNQKIAESYSLSDIFDIKDKEKESNNSTHELCKWILLNKRNPQQRASDEIEKKLARFMLNKKQAKKGSRNTGWYESDQKIADSYGLPNLFLIEKPVERAEIEM